MSEYIVDFEIYTPEGEYVTWRTGAIDAEEGISAVDFLQHANQQLIESVYNNEGVQLTRDCVRIKGVFKL